MTAVKPSLLLQALLSKAEACGDTDELIGYLQGFNKALERFNADLAQMEPADRREVDDDLLSDEFKRSAAELRGSFELAQAHAYADEAVVGPDWVPPSRRVADLLKQALEMF